MSVVSTHQRIINHTVLSVVVEPLEMWTFYTQVMYNMLETTGLYGLQSSCLLPFMHSQLYITSQKCNTKLVPSVFSPLNAENNFYGCYSKYIQTPVPQNFNSIPLPGSVLLYLYNIYNNYSYIELPIVYCVFNKKTARKHGWLFEAILVPIPVFSVYFTL